jgi:tetratricopeptide (TPR) repeat protein
VERLLSVLFDSDWPLLASTPVSLVVVGMSVSQAEQAKENGNACLAKGKIDAAIAAYSEAICLSPIAAFHTNRAMAYKRKDDWNACIADCERAHAVIKKSRSIQHKRLSVATRTSHKHCHDHHGKAGPARYDDRCKLCPSCEEAPQYAVPARLTMSSCRPTARTHSSSSAQFLSFIPELLLRPPRLVS